MVYFFDFQRLKSENVLVGSDGHLEISDFGICKIGFFHHDRASLIHGTPFHMAPEVIITLNLK
jgi:serine/threonine protein kinase